MVALALRGVSERNDLVEQNLGLAYATALKWTNARPAAVRKVGGQSDAEQICLVGLIRAAELFDPSRGCKFSTYAACCCERALQRAISMADMIRIPIYLRGEARQAAWDRVEVASLAPMLAADVDIPGREGDADGDAEQLDEVERAMQQLPPRQRCILRLRSQGFGAREIGQRMALTGERVRQLSRVALETLREILGVGDVVRGGFPQRKTRRVGG